MAYDQLFDLHENKTLLAISIRKQISNIGIGAIIWGAINIALGLFAMRINPINIGLLILGSLMLGAGIRALINPSRRILLEAAFVGLLLFAWNVTILVINTNAGADVHPRGLIIPLVITVVLFQQFRKLGHITDLIESVTPADIKNTKALCTALLKKKVKNEADVAETANIRSRVQFLGDRAFFVHKDLMRAFVASRQEVQGAVSNSAKNKIALAFVHPLGKLKYQYKKANAAKLKAWLAGGAPQDQPAA
jgi:hypothetical protein